MNVREFFHVGYGRWGLRAEQCIDSYEYYYEFLNNTKFTRFTSEQVWDFCQMAEYEFSKFVANTNG